MSEEIEWIDASDRSWMTSKTPVEFEFDNGVKRIFQCPKCQRGRIYSLQPKRWRRVQ